MMKNVVLNQISRMCKKEQYMETTIKLLNNWAKNIYLI